MTNHFHTALGKLTTDEVNALVSPLVAVLHATLEPGADAGAAREFVERYIAAVEVNGHEFAYVAPNGTRFEESAAEAESDEVVGFSHERRNQPWRRMAGALTGGKLGSGGQPFTPSTIVVAFTPSTVVVAAKNPRTGV
jgi:hypothetical protein